MMLPKHKGHLSRSTRGICHDAPVAHTLALHWLYINTPKYYPGVCCCPQCPLINLARIQPCLPLPLRFSLSYALPVVWPRTQTRRTTLLPPFDAVSLSSAPRAAPWGMLAGLLLARSTVSQIFSRSRQ